MVQVMTVLQCVSNSNMAAAKPEVLVIQKPNVISVKFQRLQQCFRGRPDQICHCQHSRMLTDTGYRIGDRLNRK